MERVEKKKLPPVFKFAVLWSILPYYGYLHKWKTLLESVSMSTQQLWKKNYSALINWGGESKLLVKRYPKKEINKNILKHAELFGIVDYWWDETGINKYSIIDQDYLFRFQNLMISLLKKLNQDNAILIWKYGKMRLGKYISFLTLKDVDNYIPSFLCTSLASNLKRFTTKEKDKLWKHLLEVIEFKVVVIKKIEDSVEVWSAIPDLDRYTEEYNIGNINSFKNLKERFSWPVYDWYCKPRLLYLNLNDDFKCRIGSLGNINENVTEKILKMNFLENIKKLIVYSKAYLYNIENLLKIAKHFLKVEIIFSIEQNNFKLDHLKKWRIKSKRIVCVYKGKEWVIESFNKVLLDSTWYFTNIKAIKSDGLIILQINEMDLSDITFRLDHTPDNKIKKYIDELNKRTKYNNDFYIITDINAIELCLQSTELKQYTSILKYCMNVQIFISQTSEKDTKKVLKMINILQKTWKWKLFITDSKSFMNFGCLNLVDSNFKNMKIYLSSFNVQIENTENSSDITNSEFKYKLYNYSNDKVSIVSIKELEEIISKQ